MTKNTETEVATQEKSIAPFLANAAVPSFLTDTATGAGNENVSSTDILISQLNLIQSLSPQIQSDSPSYIKGAQLGHMFDSVTGDLYTDVFVVNLYYKKMYQLFKKKRGEGDNFKGSFPTHVEATTFMQQEELSEKEWNIVETDIHACLLLNKEGKAVKPVLIYMSGSKARVSKAWNTSITTHALEDSKATGKQPDRFAYVWRLESVNERNKANQPYQNFKVTFAGRINDPALYEEAKANYVAMSQ